jgi:hypothetical protein
MLAMGRIGGNMYMEFSATSDLNSEKNVKAVIKIPSLSVCHCKSDSIWVENCMLARWALAWGGPTC